jgi:hypothetical protein
MAGPCLDVYAGGRTVAEVESVRPRRSELTTVIRAL